MTHSNKNLEDNYYFLREDLGKIEFDEYRRPFIRNKGKIYLSRKTSYNYTKN